MRKFSKIFAVALALCLLCGVIALSVSASTGTDVLQPTEHAYNLAEDYNDLEVGATAGWSRPDTCPGKGTYADYKVAETADGNKYLSISALNWDKEESKSYINFNFKMEHNKAPKDYILTEPRRHSPIISSVPKGEIAGTDGLTDADLLGAFTVDFDFGSNQYAWEVNGTTYMGTNPPAEAENVRLALDQLKMSGAWPYITMRNSAITSEGAFNSEKGRGESYVRIAFVLKDGLWYVAPTTGVATTTADSDESKWVALANKPGVTDHFTYVLYPNEKSVGHFVAEIYINGEKFSSHTTYGGGSERPYSFLDDFRISLQKNANYPYDFMIDNFATNHYVKGYDTSTANYTLQDYIADTDSNKKLYNCDDVVYKEGYIQTGGGYVDVNGTKAYIAPFYSNVLKNLANNGIVEVNNATVTDFIPPAGVTNFKVLETNGGSLTLDPSVAGNYVVSTSGDYKVFAPPAANQKLTLEWLDLNGNPVHTGILAINNTPDPDSFPSIEGLNYATGKITSVEKWVWNPYGEGETEISVFDAALYELIWGYVDSMDGDVDNLKVQIRPVGTTLNAAFGVINADGDVYAPGTMTFEDMADIANITTAFNTMSDGSTVKLYDHDGDNKILLEKANIAQLSKPIEYNFDLNGLTVVQYAKVTYDGSLFDITADGVTLNIFNGTIFQSNDNTSGTKEWIFGAYGIAWISDKVDYCELNIGSADGAQPINYYGGSIIYSNGKADSADAGVANLAKKNDNKIKINVTGGTVVNATRCSYNTFAVLSCDNEITVNNTTFIINQSVSHGVFGSYPGYTTDGLDIKCYDSKFFALNSSGDNANTLFGKTSLKMLNAYFEGCTISSKEYFAFNSNGSSTSTAGARVVLGPNNKVTSNISNAFVNTSDTYKDYAFDSGVKHVLVQKPETFDITYPVNFHDNTSGLTTANLKDLTHNIYSLEKKTISYTVSLITYSATGEIPDGLLPEGLVKVDFSLDGNTILDSELYEVGATVTEGPAGIELPAAESLNNGYYDLGYAWANSEGTTEVKASGNLFTPNKRVPVANVQGVKLAMSLWTHFSLDLYIPLPAAGSNVTFNGFYENDGTTPVSGNTNTREYQGTSYRVNSMFPTIGSFDARIRVAKFDVDIEGTIYTISQKFTYSQIDYAMRVANTYACGTDASAVVYNMIKYIDLAAQYGSPTYAAAARDELDAYYNKIETMHGAGCTCGRDLDNLAFSEAEKAITQDSYKDLAPYISGISYNMAASKPQLVLLVNKNAGTEISVTMTSNNYLDAGVGNIPFGEAKTAEYTSYGVDSTTTTLYLTGSIPAYKINDVITITITVDGTAYTGQYCLAEYIDAISGAQEPDTGAINAAKAFWAYSNAAYEYKFVENGEE